MFTIRRADTNDVETLVRFRLALLREIGHITAELGEAELESLVEAHRQYFTRNIAPGSFIGFVAVADRTILATGGIVLIHRPPYIGNLAGRDAYVMNMYTAPEWRGKGIGIRILAAMLAFAKEAGAKRVWLHSEPRARKLYERAGFVSKSSEMEISL